MIVKFTRAIFSPEFHRHYQTDTSWIVTYFCCYQDGGPDDYVHPSESVWVVPGTLNLEY